MLEGWLYGCTMEECIGVFLFKRKLTIDDFKKNIEAFRKEGNMRWVKEEIRDFERGLREGNAYLYCLIANLCLSDVAKLRVADVLDALREFFGKRVRMAIEVVGDG